MAFTQLEPRIRVQFIKPLIKRENRLHFRFISFRVFSFGIKSTRLLFLKVAESKKRVNGLFMKL